MSDSKWLIKKAGSNKLFVCESGYVVALYVFDSLKSTRLWKSFVCNLDFRSTLYVAHSHMDNMPLFWGKLGLKYDFFCRGCRFKLGCTAAEVQCRSYTIEIKINRNLFTNIRSITKSVFLLGLFELHPDTLESELDLHPTHAWKSPKMQFRQSFQTDSTFTITSHNWFFFWLFILFCSEMFHLCSNVALAFHQIKCVLVTVWSHFVLHIYKFKISFKEREFRLLRLPEK